MDESGLGIEHGPVRLALRERLTVLTGGLVTAVIALTLLFNTRSWGERAAIGIGVVVVGGLVILATPEDHWCTMNMEGRACLLPTAVGPGLVCLGTLILVVASVSLAARSARTRWTRPRA